MSATYPPKRAYDLFNFGHNTVAIARIMRISEPEVVRLLDRARLHYEFKPLPTYVQHEGRNA